MSNPLSKILAQKRQMRGLTFRQLEEKTGISNGYLSLIEQGKINEPSPSILAKLADFFGMDYTELLEAAGYVKKRVTPGKKNASSMAFMGEPISEDEKAELLRYLEFIRNKRQ